MVFQLNKQSVTILFSAEPIKNINWHHVRERIDRFCLFVMFQAAKIQKNQTRSKTKLTFCQYLTWHFVSPCKTIDPTGIRFRSDIRTHKTDPSGIQNIRKKTDPKTTECQPDWIDPIKEYLFSFDRLKFYYRRHIPFSLKPFRRKNRYTTDIIIPVIVRYDFYVIDLHFFVSALSFNLYILHP